MDYLIIGISLVVSILLLTLLLYFWRRYSIDGVNDFFADNNRQSRNQFVEERTEILTRLEISERERKIQSETLRVTNEELSKQKITSSELRIKLEEREKAFKDKERQLEKLQGELTKNFELISNRIVEEQGVRQKKGLHDLLNPFRDQIGEFRKRLEEVHHEETKDRASLMTEVKTLQQASEKVNEEAGNLTRALKGDVKAQGDWGEVILERVLEQSGLRLNHEYFLQVTKRSEEGSLKRPDAIVRLPEGKEVIIDAKVSLVAYQNYQSAETDETREKSVREHLVSLRGHIKRLSEQDYELLPDVRSLDFVLLFIPIEPAFNLAMQMEPSLFNEAYEKNVCVVTPTTLNMTLRIIEGIWRVENQNKNAQEIAKQAGGLYDKFRALTEDMENLSNQLRTVQRTYDSAYGKIVSGRGNLIRRVERLRTLGAKVKKPIAEKLIDSSSSHTDES